VGTFKIQKAGKSGSSALSKYQDLVLGTHSFFFLIKFELITLLFGSLPGALGLVLRKIFYPFILGRVGKGVVLGRQLTLRHPRKIFIDEGAVIDDYVMLDAKGDENQGITIGKNVFIGRQSAVYCKNGDIYLGDDVNIGHRCIVFSTNRLEIQEGTLIAAECYILSGGNYDYQGDKWFREQDGNITKGPLVIGKNCWLGAKVVVLDGNCLGDHVVIGASAVVTKPIESNSVAVGVPAKVIKKIDPL